MAKNDLGVVFGVHGVPHFTVRVRKVARAVLCPPQFWKYKE